MIEFCNFLNLLITTPWGISLLCLLSLVLIIVMYKLVFKAVFDCILAFIALVLLSPLLLVIGIIIKATSEGPMLFKQRRVGKNKKLFTIHKFRTMRVDAPKNCPTHLLDNPDKCITKIGKFLRKTSLDELPQLWDIFRLKMSIVGPRPALYNQDDLVAERDKYGANNIRPGLTGLAQISGRDELAIPIKAKIDGEYAANRNIFIDLKIVLRTALQVLKDDSVKEGKTMVADVALGDEKGELNDNNLVQETNELTRVNCQLVANQPLVDEMLENKSCDKDIVLGNKDKDNIEKYMKRILIVGQSSYVGTQFSEYLKNDKNYCVDVVSSRNNKWKEVEFSIYDSVMFVAGVVHQPTNNDKSIYTQINCDLAVEVAEFSKLHNVKQYIYLSSMGVYDYTKYEHIFAETPTSPHLPYGQSKLLAENKLQELADSNYSIAIVRPPMIFGENCKGNFPRLVSITRKTPIFPNYNNQRSMIYIENLCEFLKLVVENNSKGIFFPQNNEYFCSYEIIKQIAQLGGKKIRFTKLFNWAIKIGKKLVPTINKVFGNLIYDKQLSNHFDNKYCIVSNEESIKRCMQKEDK